MATSSNVEQSAVESRVDGGTALVGFGAALLFISLFLNWYQPGRSAWRVFETWDLVLAALSVVALLGVGGRAGLSRRRPDMWLTGPSAAAFVIVLASLINHPPAAAHADPMIGIWIAMTATVLMLVGVAMSVAHVSVAVNINRAAAGRVDLGHGQPSTRVSVYRRGGRPPRPTRAQGLADRAPQERPTATIAQTEITRELKDHPAANEAPSPDQ